MRIILHFTKLGPMRFVSHLDCQRLWQNMFRIAGIKVENTKGYNPHPRIRFALPLATGFQSENELLEVFLEQEADLKQVISAINRIAPQGLKIAAATQVAMDFPKITAVVAALEYRISFLNWPPDPGPFATDALRGAEFLLSLEAEGDGLKMLAKVDNQKSLRPDALVKHLYPEIGLENFMVTRTGIFSQTNLRLNPLPAGLKMLDSYVSTHVKILPKNN